jgi:hypothetical protein
VLKLTARISGHVAVALAQTGDPKLYAAIGASPWNADK